MIVTTAMLTDRFREYGDPAGKILRMKNRGELYPLIRGLYETDGSTPGQFLAGAIYGPSYLSFDYALSYHGLIPEAVYVFTSATCGKKKAKQYRNSFGIFNYQDVPVKAYPFGILIMEENGYSYQIACPEKALCDKLYSVSPVKNRRDIERLLFEDLRVDEERFAKLDADAILRIGERYRSNNIRYLMRVLRRSAI